jgi:hypothetical protein
VRANAVSGTPEPDLFRCERYGKFTYSIPVADGMYDRTLRFAESNFGIDNFGMPGYQGGGAGSRLFDLYCNGTTLMKEFDILKSAGVPNTAAQRTFRGLRPNAQGKLVLSFVPQRDYATVRAIEVVDEGMITPPQSARNWRAPGFPGQQRGKLRRFTEFPALPYRPGLFFSQLVMAFDPGVARQNFQHPAVLYQIRYPAASVFE